MSGSQDRPMAVITVRIILDAVRFLQSSVTKSIRTKLVHTATDGASTYLCNYFQIQSKQF